jgi:hypothetical protein
MNYRIGNPAAMSVIFTSISIAILSFLIVYGLTASCSALGITLFTTLLMATPFLIIPTGIMAIVARTRPANRFSRLTALLLLLDAALLLTLLMLLY